MGRCGWIRASKEESGEKQGECGDGGRPPEA